MALFFTVSYLSFSYSFSFQSEKGFISWLDTSLGKIVKETYTNAGRLNIMCQNPCNAVIATGHSNGKYYCILHYPCYVLKKNNAAQNFLLNGSIL